MKKLRVAVIGNGSIAKYRHIPEYASREDVELVAFCDFTIELAEKNVERFGGKAYTSYEELLANEEVDVVSVCTQNVDHAKVSIAAAKAGAHVLCEKPMATSIEDAQEMISAAKENNVQLMIGHNQRLMPPHVKAKEVLASGKLGKVLTFKTNFGHGGPDAWSVQGDTSWFFDRSKAFVGAMGDLGVHKIDLIRWLLSEEVTEVAAFVETLDKQGDVDDNATCLLRMESGAIGTMAASWTYYKGEDNTTSIYCEHGVLEIKDSSEEQVVVRLTDGTVERYQVGAIATNEEGGQHSSGVIDAFITSIQEGTEPAITGEEGMKSLNVVLAALESAETRAFVKVK
ncbi:Gfo/Idh/MocA family protein [Alkalicoccobacillus porphyridii]|uniref:Gfo/Idh/MocA family oxidoreductase n=1 Tax=Alkalicoccobacillus porphyridii TaxID=2597270 RepID=A0A553ZVK2_9BACI|nr:Gfo/Idh/MocA family oxidoreductase [Alkalicoccobacillus porphyridii]TSB45489.1 Gfo/Idh/MocA family oxidoreductase [Alkalicoccobacillus porphyridii]